MEIKLIHALVLAFFTALCTSLFNGGLQFYLKWKEEKNHAKSFELAILAEIKAMMSVIEKRKYLEFLEGIDFAHNILEGQTHPFIVDVQENYCPIYYGNLTKIGLLNKDIVTDVVEFYSLIASVIQDVKPGGSLTNEMYATKDTFQNTFDILKNAIEIGDRLLGKK